MDGRLRKGFSEKQINGMDAEAIYNALSQGSLKESIPESKVKGLKTLKSFNQEPSAISTAGSQSSDTHINGYSRKELRGASAEVDKGETSNYPAATVAQTLPTKSEEIVPIAIIGMSCHLPGGANDIEKFRELAFEGRNTSSKVPESRFNVDAFYHPDSDRPDCVSLRALFSFICGDVLTENQVECQSRQFLARNRL